MTRHETTAESLARRAAKEDGVRGVLKLEPLFETLSPPDKDLFIKGAVLELLAEQRKNRDRNFISPSLPIRA